MYYPLLLLVLLVLFAVASAIVVPITIDDTKVLSITEDIWSCVAMDWWPPSKCDYGYAPGITTLSKMLTLTTKCYKMQCWDFKGKFTFA